MAFQAFAGVVSGGAAGNYPAALACGGVVSGVAGGGLHMAAYGSTGDAVMTTGTGMASAAAVATAVAPVRRMVTLLQTQHANPKLAKKFTPHANSKFAFTWMRCLSQVLKKQGVASLWRGNLCYMVGIVPETVATLLLRDRIAAKVKRDLAPKNQGARWAGVLSYTVDMTATCTAATVVGSFTYPFMLAYTRIAADCGSSHPEHACKQSASIPGSSRGCNAREFTGLFRGERPVLSTIYRAEMKTVSKTELPIFGRRNHQSVPQLVLRGVRGLYRGLPSHVAHTVPFTTSLLVFNDFWEPVAEPFDVLAAEVGTMLEVETDGTAGKVAVAQLSAVCATAFAYPLKMMSTRLQMQSSQLEGPLYSTVWGCAKHTWHHEGVRGFYRGVLFQAPLLPVAAAGLMVYGQLKEMTEDLSNEEASLVSAVAGGALAAAALRLNA